MDFAGNSESAKLQRLRRAILVGLGLAALGVAIHPLDDSAPQWFTGIQLSGVLLGLGVACMFLVYIRRTGENRPLITGIALLIAVVLAVDAVLTLSSLAGFAERFAHDGGALASVTHMLELVEAGGIILGLVFISLDLQRAIDVADRTRKETTGELLRANDADAALRALLESTVSKSGQQYFDTLVRRLADVLRVKYAYIADYQTSDPECAIVARAFWKAGHPGERFVRAAHGTPCAQVLDGAPVSCASSAQKHFPEDSFLAELGAESYFGAPIRDHEGTVLGLVAVVHDAPLAEDQRREWILRIFGERAGVEMQRLRSEAAQRNADESLAFLADRVQDVIWMLDANLHYTYVSPALEKLVGVPAEDYVGQHMSFNIVKEDAVAAQALAVAAKEGRINSAVIDIRHHGRDGRVVTLETAAVVLRNDSAEVTGYQGVSRDVSERHAAEAKLRESEERFRFLAERMNDLIWMTDARGILTYASPSFEQMLGYKPEEVVGLHGSFNIHPNSLDAVNKALSDAVETRAQSLQLEYTAVRKDGTTVQCEISTVLLWEGDVPSGMQGITRDISARKAAEAALRTSEERYRFIAERMNDVIWVLDKDLKVTYVSPSIERITGHSVNDVIGQRSTFNTPEYELDRLREVLQSMIAGETDEAVYEHRALDIEGHTIVYEASAVALRNEVGDLVGIQGISRDITERREIESRLRERDEQYRRIVENSHDGIMITEIDSNRINFSNRRMAAMLGDARAELAGSSLDALIPATELEHARRVRKRLLTDGAVTSEFQLTRFDGSPLWANVSIAILKNNYGRPTAFLCMCTDVSERKLEEARRRDLELQVQHTQKLESLGVLAGGIAHDFNNLLAGILGHAGLLAELLDSDDLRLSHINSISLSAQRASELTKRMLAYAGRANFVLVPLNLNDLARDMTDLLHASISKNARLKFDLDPDLGMIQGDPAQINQVVMNLIINASDALHGESGDIIVRTRGLDVPESLLKRSVVRAEAARPGRYIVFEVQDTGSGISPGDIQRIFEPFFTTKFAGRGLGLAATLGIVRGHDGVLFVDSEVGAGTTFRVMIPRAAISYDSSVDGARGADPVNAGMLDGHALVADDDPTVLEMATQVLERRGMTVVGVSDGKQALDAFRADPDGFSLVVLDLTMPVMDGAMALRAIKHVRQEVPVVLCSGFARTEAIGQFDQFSKIEFVQKPYRIDELVDTVTQLMADPDPIK